ncbi:MAG: T9SS type A sorting domain-containing protein, partial [Bacteroidales bacterium]|nr:T9SS type A sorting domain-containing protein [Bacteroidales bacterium]
ALDLNAQSGVSITNCNRLVNVQTKEDNLYVEVYNALGQKVYSTREYNFNLNELPAGSYVVKAYNKRVNESVKIVIN